MQDSAVQSRLQISDQQRGAAIQRLGQLSCGFMISSALSVATKLNIADLLSEGPLSVDELAARTDSNSDGLYRVLRALASIGIFAEEGPRVFTLTPDAVLLCQDEPGSVRDLVHWTSDPIHFPIWAETLFSVKTGKPALPLVHGKSVFEVLFERPDVTQSFNDGMSNISRLTGPVILQSYDFSGIGKIVDVGAGHGQLLSAILKKYPSLQGVVYDLPDLMPGAEENIRKQGLTGRLEAVGGDMFQSVPGGADAYFMQHIIHDWADEEARTILQNCRKALNSHPEGRLLLAESVIREGNSPDAAKFIDLEMLIMCGGRERTESEYRELLASAGFHLDRIVPTGVGIDVIEARCV